MASNIFINEVQYSRDDLTSGVEGIELAGSAGTDLTDWSVVLYDGSTGTIASTTPLSGTLPNQQQGFGTFSVTYPANTLPADVPVGIALVDRDGNVVQFISYKSSVVAVEGPAAGLTSVSIAGSSSDSLQLVGFGNTFEDFTWSAGQTLSFGAINPNQTFLPAGNKANDPLLSEFVVNHNGVDRHEYIEILGIPKTDYSNFTILQIEGNRGSNSGTVDSVHPLGTTDDSGFWVTDFILNELENDTTTLLLVENFTGNAGDDLDQDNDGVLDSTPFTRIVDSVAIRNGSSLDFVYSETTLSIGFDGVQAIPAGASRIPNGADTNTSADWVRNDFYGAGLPGFVSDPDPADALNTPGSANVLVGDPVPVFPTTAIYTIQGARHRSSFVGKTLTTTGVVTGVEANGFYLQDLAGDSNIATSDSIFVYTDSAPSVRTGDALSVTGIVDEFTPSDAEPTSLSTTRLIKPHINTLSRDNALPEPVLIGGTGRVPPQEMDDDNFQVFDPNEDAIDFYESLEGMRVQIQEAVIDSPLSELGDFFVLVNVDSDETDEDEPGILKVVSTDSEPERIQVSINADLLPGFSPSITVGDRLDNVTGLLSYSSGSFRILPTEAFITPISPDDGLTGNPEEGPLITPTPGDDLNETSPQPPSEEDSELSPDEPLIELPDLGPGTSDPTTNNPLSPPPLLPPTNSEPLPDFLSSKVTPLIGTFG